MAGSLKGPNDVILGRYIINEVFEGMGIVYHVIDRDDSNRQYVAKRVSPEHSKHQEVLDWFSREIKIWQQITGHPNIVKLIEPFRQDIDGVSYFFIEYVKGNNLRNVIRATPNSQLSYPQILRWGLHISLAMEYVSVQSKNGHGVFVHRDLDSSNIMITETGVAKVNDWGISKNLLEPDDQIFLTSIQDLKGGAVGKAVYMPPEQFPPNRGEEYGIAGDVYYFGGLIYEMLTGNYINPENDSRWMQLNARTEDEVCQRLAAHHQNVALKRLRSACPQKKLVDLVANCIKVNPRKRIGNFTTIHSQLVELCNHVKSGKLKENYLECRNCSFIVIDKQTTCPVCNRAHHFERWDPVSFEVELDSGEQESPELGIEVPTVTIVHPPTAPVNDFVRIPAGEAILGAKDTILSHLIKTHGISGDRLKQLAKPISNKVILPEYFISKHAVSNDEYREFIDATDWKKPSHWQGRNTKGESGYSGEHPVVNITFLDAQAFCQWKGVRLPTNDEWERASRGTDGRAYPWGDDWKALKGSYTCNTLERHVASGEELVSVAAFLEYASPDGVLNMAGNVWEWVDGGEEYMKHTRGGSWRFQGDVYSLVWFRMPTDPDIVQDDIGFRYVKIISKKTAKVHSPIIKDLDGSVSVAGGTFSVGITPQQLVSIASKFELSKRDAQIVGQNESRSAHMSTFQIRKYLVTNEEYYQFVKETGYPWPKHWLPQLLEWSKRPFLEKYRFHPVTHVSYKDAAAFCSWHGGRLPTNDEWEVAARGEPNNIFPWGDDFDPSRCNVSESGLARTNQVNEYDTGCSPYGCFDMVGNVQEWVSPDDDASYFVRGGAFKYKGGLYGLTFLCIQADPEYTASHIGFRCVLSS